MIGRYGAKTAAAGGSEPPDAIDRSHVPFVVGFPCTRFRCRGSLCEARHAGCPVVACSVCEHVYYRITEG